MNFSPDLRPVVVSSSAGVVSHRVQAGSSCTCVRRFRRWRDSGWRAGPSSPANSERVSLQSSCSPSTLRGTIAPPLGRPMRRTKAPCRGVRKAKLQRLSWKGLSSSRCHVRPRRLVHDHPRSLRPDRTRREKPHNEEAVMAAIPAEYLDLLQQKKTFAHLATIMPDGTPQLHRYGSTTRTERSG